MTSILVFGLVVFAYVEYKKANAQAAVLMSPLNRSAASAVMVPQRYAILQTIAGPGEPVWSVPPVYAGSPQGTSTMRQGVLAPNAGNIAVGWNSLGVSTLDPLAIPANKATQYSWLPTVYRPPVGPRVNQNGCVFPTHIQ